MKTGIFYYSKTGKNKKLVEMLNRNGDFEVEEIIDNKNRNGVVGFMKSGFEAITKRLTKIENLKLNPDNFEHIIIGTPVWAGNLTPAIRTFLVRFKDSIKSYSVISTSGFGEKNKKILSDFEKILQKKPKATLFISENELGKEDLNDKIDSFLKVIMK
ncbi:MAG: flavodoxin family protein [Caldisericia bacterium]